MQNKTIIYILVSIAGCVALGLGVYFYFNYKNSREYIEYANEALQNKDFYHATNYAKVSLYYQENFDAYMILARVNNELNFFDEVIKDVNWALEHGKADELTYFLRGKSYYKLHLKGEDINVEEIMATLFEGKKEVSTNLIKAKEDLLKGAEQEDAIDSTFYYLGIVLNKLGDNKGAAENFQKFISVNKNSFEAYAERGIALYHAGDFKAALNDLNVAEEMRPKEGRVLFFKGMTNLELKDTTAACMDLAGARNNDYQMPEGLIEQVCKY
ncbi:MAG: tetratricopeptide repeat protein [Cytophagaceae bacterium]